MTVRPDATGILHVAGHVNDDVFGFLGPAVRALAMRERVQRIILIDAPEHRHNTARFAPHAEVVRIPKSSSPIQQWTDVMAAFDKELACPEFGAVHAHGIVAFLSIRWKLRATSETRIPIFHSRYGSGSFGLFNLPFKPAMRAAEPGQAAALTPVARYLDIHGHRGPPALAECPVGDLFFSTARCESTRPVIVGSGRQENIKAIERFTQLAVQLSGTELGLEFAWLGDVPVGARPKLHAAGIAVLASLRDDECAEHLRSAWIHVTPWPAGGFPLFLVQAMAAGVPCIAIDCKQHRDVIEHGTTGFLCGSDIEMVARVAELVDDPTLRRTMGNEGRRAAKERFDKSGFRLRALTASSAWQ